MFLTVFFYLTSKVMLYSKLYECTWCLRWILIFNANELPTATSITKRQYQKDCVTFHSCFAFLLWCDVLILLSNYMYNDKKTLRIIFFAYSLVVRVDGMFQMQSTLCRLIVFTKKYLPLFDKVSRLQVTQCLPNVDCTSDIPVQVKLRFPPGYCLRVKLIRCINSTHVV